MTDVVVGSGALLGYLSGIEDDEYFASSHGNEDLKPPKSRNR